MFFRLLVIFSVLAYVSGRVHLESNALAHFIKGIGRQHLRGVFPSESFIARSIDHGRSILEESASSRTDDNTKHHYVGCVSYNDYGALSITLQNMDIASHVSYSSLSDDLICVYLFSTPSSITELRNAAVEFSVLEPVPALVKLDDSIHQLQYDYLLPSATLAAVGEDAQLDSVEDTANHPIILDGVNGATITLSVMLRPDCTTGAQEAAVASWLASVHRSDTVSADQNHVMGVTSSKRSAPAHLYWADDSTPGSTLGESRTTQFSKDVRTLLHARRSGVDAQKHAAQRGRFPDLESLSPLEVPVQNGDDAKGGKQRTSKARARLNKADEKVFTERRGAWRAWGETMHALRRDGTHARVCGYDRIVAKHYKANIVLSLPRDLLDFEVMSQAAAPHVEDAGFMTNATEVKAGHAARRLAGACFSELIAAISADPLVTRAALSRPMHTLNNLAREITQLGQMGSEPLTDLGIDGTGVVIGISDTGIDETSCYFRDKVHGAVPRSTLKRPVTDHKYRKVIQYIAYSGSNGDYSGGHGSHVSGTVAGKCDYESDNASHNVYRGMASGAKIAFLDVGMNDAHQDLSIPDDLGRDVFSTAKSAGARIHSNSWGGGYLYDAFTLSTDDYLYKNQDFMVVFAAGNSGGSGAYTICSPALSKNSLAVACSDTGHGGSNIDKIASFSSHGPSLDGRNKPDITAPGNYLQSALARSEGSSGTSCSTTTKSGTSMAAPVVAGTAGLIVQYFQDSKFWKTFCDPAYVMCSRGAFTPSGTLLKALILQSGKPVKGYDGNAGVVLSSVPDTYQGYGRVNLASVLPIVSHAKAAFTLFMDQNWLPELHENVYSVSVSSSSQPLKVTISWFDPPNQVFAAKYLLHDLDLVIEDPSGHVFLGNAAVSNNLPALGAHRDEINNNEQITIPAPTAGKWRVRVQTKRLTEASHQNYSVVITAKGSVAFTSAAVPLNPALLAECAISTGTPSSTPRVSLEVAKYAKLQSNGWSPNDFYSIVPAESASPLSTGRIAAHAFEVDDVCVPAGCYTAHLNITSVTSHKGAQMAIPECDVFVSPLTPAQDFCVDPTGTYVTPTAQTPVFSSSPCASSCEADDHLVLPLYMGEYYEGAGWSGTYYAIQRVYKSNPPGFVGSLETSSAGAGTMDWGFEDVKDHCLPLRDACYALQLSIPASIVNNDMEYPVLYILDTHLPEHPSVQCPFELNTTVTLAKFCVQASEIAGVDATSTVTFYRQQGAYDLGQALTKWSDVAHAQSEDRITELGKCTGKLSYAPKKVTANIYNTKTVAPSEVPTGVPTVTPTAAPTRGPTSGPTTGPSLLPSASPSFGPSTTPTAAPSVLPTVEPTGVPSALPSFSPTTERTSEPTFNPSALPTATPTLTPTLVPTGEPSALPSFSPTVIESIADGAGEVGSPSALPSFSPTAKASISDGTVDAGAPTMSPTPSPTVPPTMAPSQVPTASPSHLPTETPSVLPSAVPSASPSTSPTAPPTVAASSVPSLAPSELPTLVPSAVPSAQPTLVPSAVPSAQPTLMPSGVPSAQPTTTEEAIDMAIIEKYANHSISCLSDCSGFPGRETFAEDTESTCYFLADSVFHLCTSYTVAYGFCAMPACAADCTPEEWCYFGAGMAISCPDRDWLGQSQDAQDLSAQCMQSLETPNSADDDAAAESNGLAEKGLSSSATAAILSVVIIVVVGAVIIALYCTYFARKSDRELLPTESTHALTSLPGEDTQRSGRSFNVQMSPMQGGRGDHSDVESSSSAGATKPSVSGDKLRSLLARSADFLRDRTSRDISPKARPGAGGGHQQRNKGSAGYEAVRSPFSIVGDADDEDEFGDDDNEYGDRMADIRV